MRSNKHSRIPPTKEIFVPATRGTEAQAKGTHCGYLIDDDQEYAQIEFYVPHDYKGFYEAVVAFISYTALTPMSMTIESDYCAENEAYGHNSQGSFVATKNTGAETLHELDVSDLINGDATVAPIEAGDYVGVNVSRATNQNTNALILGIKFRYCVFKHK